MPVLPEPFTNIPTALTQTTDPYGVYTDYIIRNMYETDGHIYQMGITSPGGFQGNSVAFVQLAAATLLWICEWTAARFNSKPNIPNPTPSDPNWVLLDTMVEPVSLVLAADAATPYYRINGVYYYGHKNPAKAQLTYGRPPWIVDKFDRFVTQDQLQSNLSDSVSRQLQPNQSESGLGFITK